MIETYNRAMMLSEYKEKIAGRKSGAEQKPTEVKKNIESKKR